MWEIPFKIEIEIPRIYARNAGNSENIIPIFCEHIRNMAKFKKKKKHIRKDLLKIPNPKIHEWQRWLMDS